jgi:amidohydrolase
MTILAERIRQIASDLLPEMVAVRRHIHRDPELSKMEFRTMEYVCEQLAAIGIPFTKGIAGTGVVGIISGKNPAKGCIALRADMDALPIQEVNEVEYKSKNNGVMHACGHDVHTACLLGVARILKVFANEWDGTVKLLFQPSEETYPGGAIGMIDEGVLKDPEPSVVIGQHVFPFLRAGQAGFRPGLFMASTDEFFLTVRGKGGHGAMPQLAVDPIVIASHIVLALQQIVSRNANPLVPTVVTIGKISSEGRTNVIPGEVRLEGTVRTFDESWRKLVHEKIATIASGTAEAMGGHCDVRIDGGYPFLSNDPGLTLRLKSLAGDYLGETNVTEIDQKMGAEDFAYFAQALPSCFYALGISNPEAGIIGNLHTPDFNVDEDAIATGMGLMAWFVVNLMGETK